MKLFFSFDSYLVCRLIELSTTSGMAHPPPPPPVESLLPPPPPPVLPGQAYSSVHTAAVTHPSSSIQPPDTTPVGQVSVSNWAPSVTVQPPAAAAACIPTSATASESQLNKNNKDTARTPKSSAKPANVEEKTLDEASVLVFSWCVCFLFGTSVQKALAFA